MESNSRCGEAPAHCTIVVATTRQPARDPDSMECGAAVAVQRRVPYGSGLLNTVQSPSIGSYRRRTTPGGFSEYMSGNVGGCRRGEWSGEATLTFQSNWSGVAVLFRVVTRVDVPIQPGESIFVSLFFSFSCLRSSRAVVLYFFYYINETRTILCGSLPLVLLVQSWCVRVCLHAGV
uniref:Uncharacterized protein n=1 Tax=Setaria viridis TaxID=4556 RepID=A0A4U6TVY7_SETVI|nr:hypothetical protein SEVIR_7G241700v2 [Setaria viridis]